MSFEKWMTVCAALTVLFATVATPIIIKIIEAKARAMPSDPKALPMFGLTVDPDAERADRMTEKLIATLEARAEAADAEARGMRLRLDAANAALVQLNQLPH